MPIQYSARLQRGFEQLDPDEFIECFAVRPLSVKWLQPVHQLVFHLANKASAEIGRTSHSRLVGAAVCRLGKQRMTDGDLEDKILGYRSAELEELVPEGAETTGNLPNGSTGFYLPEPIHALAREIQDAAYDVRPSLSDVAAAAVVDIAAFDRAQAGNMILDYAKATVQDVAPRQ